MRLSDHIMAARNTIFDVAKIATTVGAGIEKAERFELRDEVVLACIDLLSSKPTSLIAALPLCRLPYPSMWVEFRTTEDRSGPSQRGDIAPLPVKQGMLIEGFPGGQSGMMTLAWMHRAEQVADEFRLPDLPEYVINVTPVGIYFDFSPGADVNELIRKAHETTLGIYGRKPWLEAYLNGWIEQYRPVKQDYYHEFMKSRRGWEKLWNIPEEIEALRQMDYHMLPGITHHGVRLVDHVLTDPNAESVKLMMNWIMDVSGEGTFLLALIALLNSKNEVIEHHPMDLTKVNKARTKRGRPPFLSFQTTHLVLNKTQQRVYDASKAAGRLGPGEHRCRGHFKIRKTGVYWWNSHVRGDPTRPTRRKEYVVED